MSQIAIDQVLAQIRSLSAQARPSAAAPAQAGATSGISEFASILRRGIDQVNSTQQHADELADAFVRGTASVELSDVMREMQKASVALHALTEMRNRLISAYQEIMNLPL